MTRTIEQIYRHYSVRRYRSEPVARELVAQVVAAGQRASTSSNLQTYSVVAVSDEARRLELAALCGDQAQIAEAPWFLAWCADRSRLGRVCARLGCTQVTEHVESFLVAAIDAALAMQNAALAAESLGLGMCYIGGIRNHPAEVIDLLRLPRLAFPISGMTLGWPATGPFIRPRLPLEAVLHWEAYDTHGEAEALEAYDAEMIATGIYDGRKVAITDARQGDEVEVYGWQAHSARRVSRPVRTRLRQVLAEQGFGLE